MKIALRLCHTEKITGACGIIKESESCWNLVRRLKPVLESYGHQVLIIEGKNNLSDHDQTKAGADEANAWGADVYISLHMNAFNGSARGTEYIVYDSSHSNARTMAKNICNFMVSLGVPYRREIVNNQFWELKYTTMPATIIELLFCDNSQDVGIWNNTSWDTLVYGICNAIDSNIPKLKPNESESKPMNELYRVRKSWTDAASQKGAYANKENAIYECKKYNGYSVFNSKGDVVYTNTSKTIAVGSRIKIAGSNYATGQTIPSWVKNNIYTVKQLSGEKALIKEITSWVYIKDLVLV